MLNYDSTVEQIDMDTIQDDFVYLDPFISQIKNIDIQDFDYDIFQRYIEDIRDDRFETPWDEKLLPLLKYIDENYLITDYNEYEGLTPGQKKFMFLRTIKFLMLTLPYTIFFGRVLKKQFNTLTELENWLRKNDIESKLIQAIEHESIAISNIYSVIKQTIHSSTKKKIVEEYGDQANKLKEIIDYEKDFIEYFVGVIEDTDEEKLVHLLLKYYESEYF